MGSLYHYFSSKEELLLRILEQTNEPTSCIAREVSELDLPPLRGCLSSFVVPASVAAAPGEGDEGLVWRLPSARLRSQYAREAGSFSAANAERKKARLRILFLSWRGGRRVWTSLISTSLGLIRSRSPGVRRC